LEIHRPITERAGTQNKLLKTQESGARPF